MFCSWMFLSLIFVLQHKVWSDQVVSLNCSKTVEVRAGGTATMNCSIEWREVCKDRRVLMFIWKNSGSNSLICNNTTKRSGRYSCGSDSQTFVSLTISDVYQDENIRVGIDASCGMDGSDISVMVEDSRAVPNTPARTPSNPNESRGTQTSHKMATNIALVAAAIIVIAGIILYLWYKRGRRYSGTIEVV